VLRDGADPDAEQRDGQREVRELGEQHDREDAREQQLEQDQREADQEDRPAHR